MDTQGRKLPMLKAASGEEAARLIEVSINKRSFQSDDWIMVINANELVSFPHYSVWSLSLHDTLMNIGREPYGFNAVALSVLFMQDADGHSYADLPFKMLGLQPWFSGSDNNLNEFRTPNDIHKLRTRIWKHGPSNFSVNLSVCETSSGQVVPCDVTFTGKNTYPYHAQSLRFHPSWEIPFVHLHHELRKMYVLETTFGYYKSTRSYIMTDRYLY